MISSQPSSESVRYVAGVDGCRNGWVVVLLELEEDSGVTSELCRVVPSFAHIVKLPESPRYIGVDMPIGLPLVAVPGGRACDREARRMLGKRRGTSVFAPPVRATLSADTYERAVAVNRASSKHEIAISRQVYELLPKLREVHDTLNPELQLRIREVHPELSFAAMNGDLPLEHSKRTAAGIKERLELLERSFPNVRGALECGTMDYVRRDDILDAYAAAWTAWRMSQGRARFVPESPELDSRGLRMGIWF